MSSQKTWGDLAADVLEHIGISGITAPATNEDTQKVLMLMRSMVPFFENKGIYLGAYIGSDITFDPGDNSNIPDYWWLGFTSNTAVFLAPQFGREVSDSVRNLAKQSLEGMFCNVPPTNVQNPFQPAGQGDRGFYYGPRFMTQRDECSDHDGPMTQIYPY